MAESYNEPGFEDNFNSRDFSRDSVRIASEIRESGGGKQKVDVIDLSRSGFRMYCLFYIPSDRTVFLSMPGFESLEAKIAWHDGDYYGCRFSKRLHEGVYDHIVRSFPSLGGRV